jgi:hypothetical protein
MGPFARPAVAASGSVERLTLGLSYANAERC